MLRFILGWLTGAIRALKAPKSAWDEELKELDAGYATMGTMLEEHKTLILDVQKHCDELEGRMNDLHVTVNLSLSHVTWSQEHADQENNATPLPRADWLDSVREELDQL